MAWLRHIEDRPDDALAELGKTLANAPANGPALRTRLSILRGTGRVSPAEFEEAVLAAHELRPHDHDVVVELAWARFRSGDVEGALSTIEPAVRDRYAGTPATPSCFVSTISSPKRKSGARGAGTTLWKRRTAGRVRVGVARQSRIDEAISAVRKAAEGTPGSARAQAFHARLLRLCERFDDAQVVMDAALVAFPHSLIVHMEQVYLLSVREKQEAASTAMGRVLALSPENPWLRET